MTDIKLEKCVCGSAVKVREGLIGHWAGCVSGGCWYGPECKTPKKAVKAWNALMCAARERDELRAKFAELEAAQKAANAVPSLDGLLDDKAFVRLVIVGVAAGQAALPSGAEGAHGARWINDFADYVVSERIKREKERKP